jgi:pyruvate/2-oxoglutarate dehydrogenase complex dihydrolipoamide dehydrogenase (E3) component
MVKAGSTGPMDVVVIGAGPAGVMAALRAAELGARTTLVTRDDFGGMAAGDGPVPVRTLAYAARLFRGAMDLGRYGITVSAPVLDYGRLLARTKEVVGDVREHSAFREHIDRLGVTLHERTGNARFADPHTIETESGLKLSADRVILCAGGKSRRLPVPGAEWTHTHSDAWSLKDVPASMIVVGAGMTGVQVASIFQTFGTRVSLFQTGPRILPSEDEDVSAAVAAGFRASGMMVREGFGAIDSVEKTATGVRMRFSKSGVPDAVEADLVVVAIGWIADADGLNLDQAGVERDARGYVAVDEYLQTSAPHVFAAGDMTGRWMLVPQAVHDGWIAATNAVRGRARPLAEGVCPIGGFSEPEYARVGLTESSARSAHDVVVATVRFDETTRTIIDARTDGFCKLIVDREAHTIVGCSVVGDRAVEIVQVVAIAMSSRLRVGDLARITLSFPTYTGVLSRAAYRACEQLGVDTNTWNQPGDAYGQ